LRDLGFGEAVVLTPSLAHRFGLLCHGPELCARDEEQLEVASAHIIRPSSGANGGFTGRKRKQGVGVKFLFL
jgi:hypothetical protein